MRELFRGSHLLWKVYTIRKKGSVVRVRLSNSGNVGERRFQLTQAFTRDTARPGQRI
jgi:hypothetical protein